MSPLLTFGITVGIILVAFAWLTSRRSRRRHFLLSAPLPAEWSAALEKDFPRFQGLPPELQQRIGGIARVLAEEKSFEACGGLSEVTEEMKALICAQAALVIARVPKHNYYPRLRSILLYPGAFRDRGNRRFGLAEEDDVGARLGESWETGSVILSWKNVLFGARNSDDGMNVVIHEFAHQLDQVNGAADGLPLLQSRSAYRKWAEVFETNYEDLVDDVNDGKGPEPLIDPYGATNPAEFFAVASETFFEEAHELRKEHPDLYEQLKNFYGLDPSSWESAEK